ncbi:MAG UNVERIFIED_CONTAM: AAA family ATPase [Microcystis novacekii LVE1205-3]|jgi:predicted ATPase
MNVFLPKKHPLVIFIDDLQWADLPSLNLIEQLISDSRASILSHMGFIEIMKSVQLIH